MEKRLVVILVGVVGCLLLTLKGALPEETQSRWEIGDEVRRLGSDRFEEREKAAAELKKLLAGSSRDEAALRSMTEKLKDAHDHAADPEVAERLSALLKPYRGGEVLWKVEPKGMPAYGSFDVFQVEEQLIGWVPQIQSEDRWNRSIDIGSWIGVFETEKGKASWVKKGGDLPGPLQACQARDDLILAGGGDGNLAMGWLGRYDLKNGEARWSRKWSGGPVDFLKLLGSAFYASGRWGGNVDWIGKYDVESGKPLWEIKPSAPALKGPPLPALIEENQKPAPVTKQNPGELHGIIQAMDASDRILFAGGLAEWGKGWLGGYDSESGKPIWEKEGKQLPGRVRVIGVCADRVFAGGNETEPWLACYDAPTGNLVWEQSPAAASILHVCGNGVLVGGGSRGANGGLQLYHPGNGTLLWEKKPGDLPGEVVAIRSEGQVVLVGGYGQCGQGWVGCYDLVTGEPIWESLGELPGGVKTIVIHRGMVFVSGCVSGKIQLWLACMRLHAAWER